MTQSPAEIRAAQPDPTPYQSFWAGDYNNLASPAYDPWRANLATQCDLKNVPKALIYRELGSIQHIDNTWKFTIVRPVKGVELRTNDPLHVLYDEGDVYANLRVGTVEREGAVADYGGGMTPEHHPLFNGDKVFGWHTPPVEKPAKATRGCNAVLAGYGHCRPFTSACCNFPRFSSPSIIMRMICALRC